MLRRCVSIFLIVVCLGPLSASAQSPATSAKEQALASFMEAMNLDAAIARRIDAALGDMNLRESTRSAAAGVAAALGGDASGDLGQLPFSLDELGGLPQQLFDATALTAEIYAPFYRDNFNTAELQQLAKYAAARKQLMNRRGTTAKIQALDASFGQTAVASKYTKLIPKQKALDTALIQRLQQILQGGKINPF